MNTIDTEIFNTPTSEGEAEVKALEIQHQLAAIAITDQQSYEQAVAARVQAKAWLKSASDWFDGLVKPLYTAYKAALDKKKQVLDPVEQTVTGLNKALSAWDYEQEQLRLREQRRIEVEAHRQAEEQRLADAVYLEETGADAETITALLDTPVVNHVPVVAAATYEKSSAVVYRDNWGGEVTDLYALIKAVAKNKNLLGLVQINQPALNRMARDLKGAMEIPGTRPVNNRVVASGRG